MNKRRIENAARLQLGQTQKIGHKSSAQQQSQPGCAAGRLNFFSTTMVFGTPIDITLAELAVESFFPADASAEMMRRLASTQPDG